MISDGNMKMDSVGSTGYLASPVRNHPMTWMFCIDSRNTRMSRHVKTCQKMSLVEVVCDVSSIVIFGPAPNLEVFRQHFGMEGPIATLYSASHCHTIHLRS